MKTTISKIAYFSLIECFPLLPEAAQMALIVEFMLSNVAYRATVYRTGNPVKLDFDDRNERSF